jgi:hypothetical protein
MAALMLVAMMAVVVAVLMGMGGRHMGVLMAIVRMGHVIVGVLMFMLVFGMATHLLSPPV